MQFLKDALRELKHVVWPTRAEAKRYFGVVLVVLILFGLYLFIVNNVFSYLLFDVLKPMFEGTESTITDTFDPSVLPEFDLTSINGEDMSEFAGSGEVMETTETVEEAVSTGATEVQ
ncbi:MAG: preprotein translocase subunit SecE [Candidatus Peribacteria bacterium]|nr:MAG: preprotein translocase subunit SecE [Candidatus Peribacteria bacterium]